MKKPEYYTKALKAGVALSLFALSSVNSHAAIRNWNGDTDNDFSTASNWNVFPTGIHSARMQGDAGDSLTVLSGGNTHSMAAINVRSGHTFTIDNAGGTLTGTANFNFARGATGDGSAVNQLAGDVVLGGLDMSGNETGGDSIYTISGGTLTIGSADTLDVGGDGLTGNVGGGSDVATFAIVGDSATVSVTDNVLARASSVFSFSLGATGIDAIDTTGNIAISSGATLTVDGASYTGGEGNITLFSYATRTDTTEFTENVTNFAGLNADVVYDEDSIDLVLTSNVNPEDLAITLFFADEPEINPGGSTTLNWTVQNETTLTLDQSIGDVFGTTSIVVSPSTTTTYTLTAGDGVNPDVMDTVTVTVLPQIDSFTASDTLVGSGDTVTLNWTVTNATGLTLNPGGINVTGLTTTDVTPTADTTYELVATNGGTDVNATVDVLVGPIIDSFTANQYYIISGSSVNIDWTTENLGSSPSLTLTADNMIDAPSNTDVLNETLPLVLSPSENTTYTLTASDGVNDDVTATFDIVIIPDYPVIPSEGRVISVNFHVGNDADAQADHELTIGETAGFIPRDGSVWNNINVGNASGNDLGPIFASTVLNDDLGNPSVATLAPSVDSTWFVGYAASSAAEAGELNLPGDDDNLFNSYLALNGPNGDGTPADAAILNISGLGSDYTSGGYTLIIYSDSDRRNTSNNTRQSLYTLTPSAGSPVTAFVEDDDQALGINIFDNTYVFSDYVDDGADYSNFVIFEGLTADSFSLEISSADGGRGAISGFQIIGNTGLPTAPLLLNIAANGANLDFDWNSIPGVSYNLRGSSSLDTAPSTWTIVTGQDDILATPPTNTLSIPRPVDDKFFYVLEELPTPAE
ncbi:MAG: beta strand repeat-containing protein [Luteolibacter sp.]